MQINRETQDFASLLFLQHKFQPIILTPSSQCASLVVGVFWCMHIGMDCSGDARFCVSTFPPTQIQTNIPHHIIATRQPCCRCFFATRIIVEKKRHTTHRKLTENRVYPDNIYFASVYADFSAYA